MTAIRQSPWPLRFYAGLIVVAAIVAAHERDSSEIWLSVLWTAAFGIAVCTARRAVWWLLATGNVLILIETLANGHQRGVVFFLTSLALLLTLAPRYLASRLIPGSAPKRARTRAAASSGVRRSQG